jgi:hypothetical protein
MSMSITLKVIKRFESVVIFPDKSLECTDEVKKTACDFKVILRVFYVNMIKK